MARRKNTADAYEVFVRIAEDRAARAQGKESGPAAKEPRAPARPGAGPAAAGPETASSSRSHPSGAAVPSRPRDASGHPRAASDLSSSVPSSSLAPGNSAPPRARSWSPSRYSAAAPGGLDAAGHGAISPPRSPMAPRARTRPKGRVDVESLAEERSRAARGREAGGREPDSPARSEGLRHEQRPASDASPGGSLEDAVALWRQRAAAAGRGMARMMGQELSEHAADAGRRIGRDAADPGSAVGNRAAPDDAVSDDVVADDAAASLEAVGCQIGSAFLARLEGERPDAGAPGPDPRSSSQALAFGEPAPLGDDAGSDDVEGAGIGGQPPWTARGDDDGEAESFDVDESAGLETPHEHPGEQPASSAEARDFRHGAAASIVTFPLAILARAARWLAGDRTSALLARHVEMRLSTLLISAVCLVISLSLIGIAINLQLARRNGVESPLAAHRQDFAEFDALYSPLAPRTVISPQPPEPVVATAGSAELGSEPSAASIPAEAAAESAQTGAAPAAAEPLELDENRRWIVMKQGMSDWERDDLTSYLALVIAYLDVRTTLDRSQASMAHKGVVVAEDSSGRETLFSVYVGPFASYRDARDARAEFLELVEGNPSFRFKDSVDLRQIYSCKENDRIFGAWSLARQAQDAAAAKSP